MDYFALLSKEQDTNDFVSHISNFPPLSADEYDCFSGTFSRLTNVLISLQSSRMEEKAHTETVNKYALDIINNPNFRVVNSPHVMPFINYLLGVKGSLIEKYDNLYMSPIAEITRNQAWKIVKNYDKDLQNNLLEPILGLVESFKDHDPKNPQNYPKLYSLDYRKKFDSSNPSRTAQDFAPSDANDPKTYPKLVEILKANGVFDANDEIEFSIFFKENDESKTFFQWRERDDLREKLQQKIAHKISSTTSKNRDYFCELFTDEEDITNPQSIEKISQLIKSDNQNEREVGINILRLLGENFTDHDPIHFLSILDKAGYAKGLKYQSIPEERNQEGQIIQPTKLEIDEENKPFSMLISRIDDMVDIAKSQVIIEICQSNYTDEAIISNDARANLIKYCIAFWY